MVLFPENLKVSKSMKQLLRKEKFKVTFNKDFRAVIEACADIRREGQHGTWITQEMIDCFGDLHELNIAHSVEVWEDDNLVGGLYGIYLEDKKVFCGESMFTRASATFQWKTWTTSWQLEETFSSRVSSMGHCLRRRQQTLLLVRFLQIFSLLRRADSVRFLKKRL